MCVVCVYVCVSVCVCVCVSVSWGSFFGGLGGCVCLSGGGGGHGLRAAKRNISCTST